MRKELNLINGPINLWASTGKRGAMIIKELTFPACDTVRIMRGSYFEYAQSIQKVYRGDDKNSNRGWSTTWVTWDMGGVKRLSTCMNQNCNTCVFGVTFVLLVCPPTCVKNVWANMCGN